MRVVKKICAAYIKDAHAEARARALVRVEDIEGAAAQRDAMSTNPGTGAGPGPAPAPTPAPAGAAATEMKSKADKSRTEVVVDVAEIRKEAQDEAARIAQEATVKAKERLEAEKMQRLQKPRETNTATVREAAKEVVGTVAKVDGVAWTVAEDQNHVKHWVSGYARTEFDTQTMDSARFKSHLSTCDCPQDQGALGPGALGQGAPASAQYGSSCVPGTSPFTPAKGPQDTRCASGSVPAVLTSGLLADRPVRLPKVMPAVDVATANAAAEWLQGARLHEQLACANSAAEQRLVQAKQQYYLSIGLLCDADKEAVKQRLEAVVQACAARKFELDEQRRAQSNLEAEIIAAQQIMQDVHADLEGKHAQGDTFGVQYAAEELKLAKYKVLLLLKQKRRLKAMVAIHVCNEREAQKAQKAAECEFADAMARHEHARRVMIRNHDLDDSAEQQLAQVQKQLDDALKEMGDLSAELRNTREQRQVTEDAIRKQEDGQRSVLNSGLSAGQQTADLAATGAVNLSGGAGPDLTGGGPEEMKNAVTAVKAAKEARKIIAAFAEQHGLQDVLDANALGLDTAEEEQQRRETAEAQRLKQLDKEQKEATARVQETKRAAITEFETQYGRAQEQLQAQIHAIEVGTQRQARQAEELRVMATTGFLGTDKLESRRDIATNVQLLMSLRFKARRYREKEAEIEAKLMQVRNRVVALQDKQAKLKERIHKEEEKRRGQQHVEQTTSAPPPVSAPVTASQGCDVGLIVDLDAKSLQAITDVRAKHKTLDEFTFVMVASKPTDTLSPCYGRLVKRQDATTAGGAAPKPCLPFEWFYEGQINNDCKPAGLGTFTLATATRVYRCRGTWQNGDLTRGVLEKWATPDKARNEPPQEVSIGEFDPKVQLPLGKQLTEVKVTPGIVFTYTKDSGVLKLGTNDIPLGTTTFTARQQGGEGSIEYMHKNNDHLLCYWPQSVDSRTAATYCWQWHSEGEKVTDVVVQVGTVVNQLQPLGASMGTVAKNLVGWATGGLVASVTSYATAAGPWRRAVHTGVQCVFNGALGGANDQYEVSGYNDGTLVRTSKGQMLCGLAHGRHQVNFEGAEFYGQCFNGCPSLGYVSIPDTDRVIGGRFWGTFLTPSASKFTDAWKHVSNTGRRAYTSNTDIYHNLCRRKIVGPDRDSERKEATIAAVRGATAANQTGLTSLPAQVFQEHAKDSAQPLCGGADVVPDTAGTAHVFGRVPDTVGEQLEGGTGTDDRPQSGAPQVDALISAGGDGREWDGGISPSWLQEARRRVDDLCVQMERLHQGDLPASAQVELSERALQYASTFADVLKKKPVCGPGLLRPMARKLAASLDASFAGLGNAQVMAQLAAWFRLEC
jgi:hypothetical protein